MLNRISVTLRRVIVPLGCVGCAACRGSEPARIAVPSDTAVINSTEWTPIGVRVLDVRGRAFTGDVAYTSLNPHMLQTAPNGAVNCWEDGLGAISVAAGAVRARVRYDGRGRASDAPPRRRTLQRRPAARQSDTQEIRAPLRRQRELTADHLDERAIALLPQRARPRGPRLSLRFLFPFHRVSASTPAAPRDPAREPRLACCE